MSGWQAFARLNRDALRDLVSGEQTRAVWRQAGPRGRRFMVSYLFVAALILATLVVFVTGLIW